jgi:hypothetical protein
VCAAGFGIWLLLFLSGTFMRRLHTFIVYKFHQICAELEIWDVFIWFLWFTTPVKRGGVCIQSKWTRGHIKCNKLQFSNEPLQRINDWEFLFKVYTKSNNEISFHIILHNSCVATKLTTSWSNKWMRIARKSFVLQQLIF